MPILMKLRELLEQENVPYSVRSHPEANTALRGTSPYAKRRRWPLAASFLCLFFVSAAGPAVADTSRFFTFEDADIQTVVKQVAALTGITFLFDPEQVKGKITLLAPKAVAPEEALELLRSVLALHGYTLLSRAEGIWIVPAELVASEVFTIKVVPLSYARAGEVAYALSWVAPPSVRIVPYYPTNSLIISGHPATVEGLIDLIK
jgi:general secretion pathway protein D